MFSDVMGAKNNLWIIHTAVMKQSVEQLTYMCGFQNISPTTNTDKKMQMEIDFENHSNHVASIARYADVWPKDQRLRSI